MRDLESSPFKFSTTKRRDSVFGFPTWSWITYAEHYEARDDEMELLSNMTIVSQYSINHSGFVNTRLIGHLTESFCIYHSSWHTLSVTPILSLFILYLHFLF